MKLKYRPEIDGLRSIAVISVILYHARIDVFDHQFFEGGFIGVDIFFVISGYLITSIILNELIVSNSFSFKYFYERRIRRIFPALLFVILLSLPFAWIYLLPSAILDYSKSILYSLGFGSNFYFHYSGQAYGAESSYLKPFLHTWSLSVEEQYYLIVPLILLFLFKFLKKYISHIFIFGFIISLGLAEWASRYHPSFNFYMLPTRGWELLAGSILAYFEINLSRKNSITKLNFLLPPIGIILIIYSLLFFNDKMYLPSIYSLPAIIGVCLIIWFSNPNELITKILSSKPFVFTGLISYSLYLWHYPIFAFAEYTGFIEKYFLSKFFLILLTIILSIFTFYFIEKKFRKKNVKFSKIFIIIILIYIFNLAFLSIVIFKNGLKERFPELIIKIDSEKQIYNSLKNKSGNSCLGYYYCDFGPKSSKKIFIIGDSHMATISLDLHQKLKERNYEFIPLTVEGCYFFTHFDQFNNRYNKIQKRCSASEMQKRLALIKENPNSIIIIGGNLPYHLSGISYDNYLLGNLNREFDYIIKKIDYNENIPLNIQENLSQTIINLSQTNKIIIVYPYPEISFSVKEKIRHKFFLGNENINNILKNNLFYEPYKNYKLRAKKAIDLLNSIKGRNIYRVYTDQLICDTIIKEGCVTNNDKNIFYSDTHHPSYEASRMINNLILDKINQIN